MNQANFLFGYEVITMIIVLVTTKEKSLGTNFNQQNWMLVFRQEKEISTEYKIILNSGVGEMITPAPVP